MASAARLMQVREEMGAAKKATVQRQREEAEEQRRVEERNASCPKGRELGGEAGGQLVFFGCVWCFWLFLVVLRCIF